MRSLTAVWNAVQTLIVTHVNSCRTHTVILISCACSSSSVQTDILIFIEETRMLRCRCGNQHHLKTKSCTDTVSTSVYFMFFDFLHVSCFLLLYDSSLFPPSILWISFLSFPHLTPQCFSPYSQFVPLCFRVFRLFPLIFLGFCHIFFFFLSAASLCFLHVSRIFFFSFWTFSPCSWNNYVNETLRRKK